ncbi:MAG: D-alanine--poly(phosphoribitol) ligase subunit DltA [Anaerolineae bacterium]|nr:D-alanine--poly(phosphoribitol) ligase subunit DltA [Anaerolineae bacterium]
MHVLDRIARWAAVTPDRPAHLSQGRRLTYADLRRQSDALAAHLACVLPDDRSPVAVIGHKEPEMLVGFLGAVKAGHPYVPIDTSLPEQRIQRILALANASLVLRPADIAHLSQGDAQPPDRMLAPGDPYYVIFTSGSTGEPKGVVITLGNLTSFVDWMMAEHAPVEGQEVYLNQAPFSFDLSVMDLYMSLTTGGTLFSLVRDDIANPRQLYQTLAASQATVWVSTPSFAQMCLAERRFDAARLPTVRRFLFCGETLAAEVAAQLLDRFPAAQVWNTYGPTEATVATTSVQIDRAVLARFPDLPVGYPKPGSQILITDETRQPVPPGERGEIVIVGPNVSPGYLNRPDLNARVFQPVGGQPAYRTGDRGYLQDGLLFFEGRLDHQVKLHGYRIELGDVETHLRSLAMVRDAVVVPQMKHGKVEALVAFVILAEPPTGAAFEITQQLRGQLAERVPSYMVPGKFRYLDVFPITPNGKADRRALIETLA